jgi:hypothetical protein
MARRRVRAAVAALLTPGRLSVSVPAFALGHSFTAALGP